MPEDNDTIIMHPVGYVQNDILEPVSAWTKKDLESRLILKEEYAEGLTRIGDFDKLQVFFFFNLSTDFQMIQKRCYDNKYAGVFATRSPNRPNGIGSTVVTLLKAEGNILHVKGLDAVNNTPVLDIKPYID